MILERERENTNKVYFIFLVAGVLGVCLKKDNIKRTQRNK